MSQDTQSPLINTLDTMAANGFIRQIDYRTALFMYEKESGHSDAIGWLAALLSYQLGLGHICLELIGDSGEIELVKFRFGFSIYDQNVDSIIQSTDWLAVLAQSELVGKEGENTPLIFDGQRLYFHRYWAYEVRLAQRIAHFAKPTKLEPIVLEHLSQELESLFSRDYRYLLNFLDWSNIDQDQMKSQVVESLDVIDSDSLNWDEIFSVLHQASKSEPLTFLDELIPLSRCLSWQKVAAAVALTRRFAVISGGPGTGKTTTVSKLLAALVSVHLKNGKEPTIELVAPTGKAAARLTESIGSAIEKLPVSQNIKMLIPTKSSTIHRLLGSIPQSSEFRHHAQNRLHLDILVVDEASMVDLPMMCKLFEALPDYAHVILLGDKDQLASVEAGAVLGDICSFLEFGYSMGTSQLLSRITGFDITTMAGNSTVPKLSDNLCMLRKSYRFNEHSGIGQLAKAVNIGDRKRVDTLLSQEYSDISYSSLSGEGYTSLLTSMKSKYQPYLQLAHQLPTPQSEMTPVELKNWIKPVLDAFGQSRLLCAIREGEFGVSGLNNRIERVLANHKLIPTKDEVWYIGRPIMISRNDYSLGLYNGDIGICLPDISSAEPRLKVYFELPDGTVKGVLPSRIPEHELAYAMTIHKSQGSEFDHVFMLLPPDYSPVLTRELVYTGITRAKSYLGLFSDKRVLGQAISMRTERNSGLSARLAMI